jgi:hypothetical protein
VREEEHEMSSRSASLGPIRLDDPAAHRECGEGELRCGCGSLLARVVGRVVELKCRRCKRIWSIPLEGR